MFSAWRDMLLNTSLQSMQYAWRAAYDPQADC